MSEKKKRKSGAGRKKGSVSFCLVPLTELNSKLPSGAIIVVSRKFAEAMSIEGQPVISTPNMMMPLATAAKASAVQVTDLNDEETAPELSIDNW
tara:strand:- start:2782 stop:3063 length:282 start_codon:yes stop_codon:yes gene_type:complete